MLTSFRTMLLAGVCLAGWLPNVLHAEAVSGALVPSTAARHFGLNLAWFTQAEVDAARGRLVHVQQFISGEDSYTVHDVTYGNRKRTFNERDLDRFGDVLGAEGALKAANRFIEDLKAEGVEGKLETKQIPDVTLYLVTNRAVVQAIDGETGRTRWTQVVGNRNHPTVKPAVNEKYLAVLTGSFLHLLDRRTGEVIWKRMVTAVPGAGLALTESFAIVPSITGDMELYDLEETRTMPQRYRSNGRVLIEPTVTPLSIAWPTDRGFLYVARSNNRGLRYRLEAQEAIVSPAAYFAPDRLFATSIDGYVYNLQENSGSEDWRFSTGESISNSPVPIGDSVYVVTDKGNLFAIEMASGAQKWVVPSIRKFISASQDRLYCLGISGRLVIIDAKSGGRVGTFETGQQDIQFVNLQTDRMFLGTTTGVLQCLHETQLPFPLLHQALAEATKQKPRDDIKMGGINDPAAKPAQPAQPAAPAGADPFGGGAAQPPAGGAADPDPFGGGAAADPFGAGGGAAGAAKPPAAGAAQPDPFGGAANDPFK